MKYNIVATDYFDRDYTDEHFLESPDMNNEDADTVVKILNRNERDTSPTYWKAVPVGYKLRMGSDTP